MASLIQPENSHFDLPAAFVSLSGEETFALGKRLSPMLGKGDVVALSGPLGAGKTCFAKGIAVGLGIGEEITSPSYAIISEYECSIGNEKIPVYHIDAYRLEGNDDFSAIGGEEIVFGNGISIVEWSDRIPDFIPSEAYRVDIDMIEDNKRNVKIAKQGRQKVDEYFGH